ncbi:MAG: citrate:proton symporter [Neisseria sp.]|nr:citrate:proton symporter [Neisseria sp.]
MLTVIGLAIILVIVVLLLAEKVSPVICMVLVPLVGAVVAGFDFETISQFYSKGIGSVTQIVVMFVFAILFFGVMNDVGLFDPMIRGMIKLTRGNVVAVTVGTVIVSVIAQLDGAGASTFLLVVPPLLPLYKRLRMNPYLLFLLLAASAGLINMLPWGGPLGRVATVLSMDVVELWKPLIIVQVIGVVMLLVLAVFLGLREQRRIRAAYPDVQAGPLTAAAERLGEAHEKHRGDSQDEEAAITQEWEETGSAERKALLRPHLRWVNALIFLSALAVLVSGIFPPGYVFMIALCIALVINYPKPHMQIERITAHAGGAVMMASIILAAGTFLGILKESGMLNEIAVALVSVLPNSLLPYLHIAIGIIGIPLELVLSTDAYYFALFPVVEQITSQAGVLPASAGYAMIIGSIVGTFVTPFSPALWMGLGLARLSMGQHIRYSFFWVWGFSLLLLLVSYMIGVF